MLNNKINYPYPLLQEETEQFKTTSFSSSIEVLREPSGFRIIPRFSVNNDGIKKIIADGLFSYAIQIQCTSTWLRTIHYVKENEPFFIEASDVHERVDLSPCIIAMEDLYPYYNDDFVDGFKGVTVGVKKNDIVGIGQSIWFTAYYKADEVRKPNSVITVKDRDDITRMEVDLSQIDNIYVYLPSKEYGLYMAAGTNTANQILLLNAVLSIPALTYAISNMTLDDDNDFSENSWYKSLRAYIEKMAGGDQAKVQELLNNPISTAQEMLGDNYSSALQVIYDMGM